MHRTYKFRLYPNRNQVRELEAMVETLRRLYNAALEQRKTIYEAEARTIGFAEQCRWFTEQKKNNRYYQRLNRRSAEVTLKQLDLAFAAFFRRVKSGVAPGYPRFKGREFFHRIPFRCGDGGASVRNGRLRVQHVGLVRMKQHRAIEGRQLTITVFREGMKWYAAVVCELPDMRPEQATLPPAGIDVGVESFATTSDGEQIANPRFFKEALPELRRQQRSLCRKKKGGKNRKKQRARVAKCHAKVRNQRKHFHHLTANELIRRYGVIAVESLNVRGMLRNRRLARAIADAGWSGFISILKYKAESAGVRVVEVDCRGTSQECSQCGEVVQKPLSQRWHECSCGLSIHRDHNAARNILARGLAGTLPAGFNGHLDAVS